MRPIHFLAILAFALLTVAGVAQAKIDADSGNLDVGATFENTFDQAGTWTYFCAYHATTMTGTIEVEDGAATAPVEIGMTTNTTDGVKWFYTHDGRAESGLTVTIGPGTTVTWMNDDPTGAAHTVTEDEADFASANEGSAIGFVAVLLAGLALVALRRRGGKPLPSVSSFSILLPPASAGTCFSGGAFSPASSLAC